MQPRERKAFIYSGILHGVIFAGLFLGMAASNLKAPPEQKHYFEIVVPSEDRPGPKNLPKAPGPPSPERIREQSMALPDFGSVPEIPKIAPKQAPEQPTQAPAPTPTPKPSQAPATKKEAPKQAAPSPQKSPTPAAAAAPQTVSFSDFQKKHGSTSNSKQTKKTSGSSKPVNVPKIDVSGITGDLSRMRISGGGGGTGGAGPGGVSATDFDRWKSAVYLRIDAVWERPETAVEGIEARVAFEVTANGTITKIRVEKSSGNSVFDQSILQALRMVGRVQPPPGGVAIQVAAPFRMEK